MVFVSCMRRLFGRLISGCAPLFQARTILEKRRPWRGLLRRSSLRQPRWASQHLRVHRRRRLAGRGAVPSAAIKLSPQSEAIARRVLTDALPMCGVSTTFVRASSAGHDHRLAFEYVQTGGRDAAFVQRHGQRGVVHHAAARDVGQRGRSTSSA